MARRTARRLPATNPRMSGGARHLSSSSSCACASANRTHDDRTARRLSAMARGPAVRASKMSFACPCGHAWGLRFTRTCIQTKCRVKVEKGHGRKFDQEECSLWLSVLWHTPGSLQETLGLRATPQLLWSVIFCVSQRTHLNKQLRRVDCQRRHIGLHSNSSVMLFFAICRNSALGNALETAKARSCASMRHSSQRKRSKAGVSEEEPLTGIRHFFLLELKSIFHHARPQEDPSLLLSQIGRVLCVRQRFASALQRVDRLVPKLQSPCSLSARGWGTLTVFGFRWQCINHARGEFARDADDGS